MLDKQRSVINIGTKMEMDTFTPIKIVEQRFSPMLNNSSIANVFRKSLDENKSSTNPSLDLDENRTMDSKARLKAEVVSSSQPKYSFTFFSKFSLECINQSSCKAHLFITTIVHRTGRMRNPNSILLKFDISVGISSKRKQHGHDGNSTRSNLRRRLIVSYGINTCFTYRT